MAEYFIADPHLDHRNIIKHCTRPFKSVGAMNRAIVRNWRDTVTPQDTVYFIGDLALGRPAWWWLKRLPGKVVFIKGNHDRGIPTMAGVVLSTELGDILLVHNPHDAKGWPGWAIHGHVHNTHPFIDFNNRRVNVSVDVIGYKPVSLDIILGVIAKHETPSKN